jgi:cyclopropane fatty-acyl-phospholipid synthase-like methyltransferase
MRNFISNQFRRPSGFWGRIVSALMKKGNKLNYIKLISELEIKSGDRILEIGYGHGLGINMIFKEFDCSITGIDFSELMYKEASSRNKKYLENGKLSLNFGDYLSFSAENNSFDKVFFINVIYFWKTLESPFIKIKNELKTDGVLCIYMAHRDDLNRLNFTSDNVFNKYTIEFVTEELKKYGFREIEYKFDRGYYIRCRK